MLNDLKETLKAYVNRPSGSNDKDDVNEVGALIRADFESLGFNVTAIPGKKYGDVLVCRIGTGKKQLMLMGHMDTVFPRDMAVPFTPVEGSIIKGSGITDMKGGIAVMLYALKDVLPKIDLAEYSICAVINADEEVGASESFDVILNTAKESFAALSFEPMRAGNYLVSARKGVTSLLLECKGIPGHAGVAYTSCASAIQALCAQITKLYSIRDDAKEISFNVGVINGGTATNVVAPYASAKCEFRYFNEAYKEPLKQKILELTADEPVSGATTTVTFGGNHPACDDTEASMALAKTAFSVGEKLGIELHTQKTGGAGDIAIAALAGIGVLDGLGNGGGGIHTTDEYCDFEMTKQNVALASGLIAELCK